MSLLANPADITIAINAAMRVIEPQLLEALRSRAPVATGDFAAGLESRINGAGVGALDGMIEIEVFSTVDEPLMEYVIEGTGAHTIGGEGQFLYNADEEFGAAGPVEHPGTLPNDFSTPALQAMDERAQLILATAIMDAIVL